MNEKLYYVQVIKGSEGGYLGYQKVYGQKLNVCSIEEAKKAKRKYKFTEAEIKTIDERFWEFAVPVKPKAVQVDAAKLMEVVKDLTRIASSEVSYSDGFYAGMKALAGTILKDLKEAELYE